MSAPTTVCDMDLNTVFAPAWAAIQQRHPELPPIAFALSMHCTPAGRRTRAWVQGYGDRDVRSDGRTITFTPYGLRGSVEDVFITLLHETAHVLDWLRPGHSNSAHGIRFADAAVELGLNVWLSARSHNEWWRIRPYPSEAEQQSRRFWHFRRYDTEWSDDLRPVYATVLDDLNTALTPWKNAIIAATPSYCPIPKDML